MQREIIVEILKDHRDIYTPEYETVGAAGADVRSSERCILQQLEPTLVPTGLKVDIPLGYEIQIRPRSGLAMQGVTVANSPGTIDSDYEGQVMVLLINYNKKDFIVGKGDRIAQMVLSRVERARYQWVPARRGEGGFGSTGM